MNHNGQVQEIGEPRSPVGARAECTDWDAFIASNPMGHHEQCSRYAQLRERYGLDCHYALVKQEGKIAAGAQVLVQTTPIGRMGFVYRGPCADSDDSGLMREAVEELERLSERLRLASLRVDSLPPQERLRQALHEAGFKANTDWNGQFFSCRIGLEQSEAEILAAMHQKGRYHLRQASQAGVEVVVGDQQTLSDFYNLYCQSGQIKQYNCFPLSYFQYLWDLFGEHKRVQHFIAYYQGQPVAAVFNTMVGDQMLYGWGGVDRGQQFQKVKAGYAVHYAALLWAKQRGCQFYDLAGIFPGRTGGVTRFKTRMAPDRFDWPASMWKYYGPLGSVRSKMSGLVWNRPLMRRAWMRWVRRCGYFPTMPY